MAADVSELFDASEWADAAPAVTGSGGFSDITYHHSLDGRIARIAFDRVRAERVAHLWPVERDARDSSVERVVVGDVAETT